MWRPPLRPTQGQQLKVMVLLWNGDSVLCGVIQAAGSLLLPPTSPPLPDHPSSTSAIVAMLESLVPGMTGFPCHPIGSGFSLTP